LWDENSARWAITLYACVLTGVVAVPIDASFSQQFVDKIQHLTDARYICSDRNPESWNRLLEKQLDFKTTDFNDVKIPKDALLEIISSELLRSGVLTRLAYSASVFPTADGHKSERAHLEHDRRPDCRRRNGASNLGGTDVKRS